MGWDRGDLVMVVRGRGNIDIPFMIFDIELLEGWQLFFSGW